MRSRGGGEHGIGVSAYNGTCLGILVAKRSNRVPAGMHSGHITVVFFLSVGNDVFCLRFVFWLMVTRRSGRGCCFFPWSLVRQFRFLLLSLLWALGVDVFCLDVIS